MLYIELYLPTNYNHLNAIVSQSKINEQITNNKKTHKTNILTVEDKKKLKHNGTKKKNSISYRINKRAIKKKPKLIETRNA